MSWLTVTTLAGFAVSAFSSGTPVNRLDSPPQSLPALHLALVRKASLIDSSPTSVLNSDDLASSDRVCSLAWESWNQAEAGSLPGIRGRPPVGRYVDDERPACNQPTGVAPSPPVADDTHASAATDSIQTPSPNPSDVATTVVGGPSTPFLYPPSPAPTPMKSQYRTPVAAGKNGGVPARPLVPVRPHHAEAIARPNPAPLAQPDPFMDDDLDDDLYLPEPAAQPKTPGTSVAFTPTPLSTVQPSPLTWLAEGRELEVIFTVHGTLVIATYVTGTSGAPPHLVIPTPTATGVVAGLSIASTRSAVTGSPVPTEISARPAATLFVGGPAETYNGELLSLESHGLVVGSRTIPIAAIAPLVPTDSAAVITVEGRPVTFLKQAGNPAVMLADSQTISIGGPAMVTDGHTIILNTHGQLVMDETQTVDPTPVRVPSRGAHGASAGVFATAANKAGAVTGGTQTSGILVSMPKKTAVKADADRLSGQSGIWSGLGAIFAAIFML